MSKRFPTVLACLLGLVFILSACTSEEPEVLGDSPEMSGEAAKAGSAGVEGDAVNEHVKRGDEYLEQGNVEEAIKAFDDAIALNPGDGDAYVKKGIALSRAGKFEQAIPLMDKALQVSGRDKTWQWYPLYHKGAAQAMSGDLEAALESFNKSIESNPNHQNYHGRAKTYADLGEPHKALADVQAGLQHKPDDYMLNMFVSHLEARMNTRTESEAFMKDMAAKDGARKTDSGLIYFELKKGDGEKPAANDTVLVHYQGTLIGGKVFESSTNRDEPGRVTLNQTIPCWTEGMQLMRVGGKAKLICPAELGYGDRGVGSLIKPGAALVFEVELLGIEQAQN